MKLLAVLAIFAAASFALGSPVSAQGPAPANAPAYQETSVTTHATGTFEVTLTPMAPEDGDASALGRMTIDKKFHGDLEATSQGQMLSFLTSTRTSGGYVALERVTGTLQGKKGSFVLQHSGTMNRGTPSLSVTVVPESGTEELTGISGGMQIIIESGKHSYDFEYSIAP